MQNAFNMGQRLLLALNYNVNDHSVISLLRQLVRLFSIKN